MDPVYEALIESSPGVSTPTRRALRERAQLDPPDYVPLALAVSAFGTLRVLMELIIPQSESVHIDLAARLDRQLAQGVGDGWRHASLPPDADAYRAGLATLDAWSYAELAQPFANVPLEAQTALLYRVVEGRPPPDLRKHGALELRLTAEQMVEWFADVRADAVRLYIAHPETLCRMGYSGIANGGDGEPKSGFVRVGIDQRESWEPVAHDKRAP